MNKRLLSVALVAITVLGLVLILKQRLPETAGNDASTRAAASKAEPPPANGPVSENPEDGNAESVAAPEAEHHDHDHASGNVAPRITATEARIESVFLAKANRRISFDLPGGREAIGVVELTKQSAGATVFVQGRITEPQSGFFFFRKQTEPGVAGAMTGVVRFDEGEIAYRVEPLGDAGEPVLVERPLDEVICHEYAAAELASPLDPAEGDVPLFVPQLESLPGAKAVAYLDFDGEEGPHEGWGDFYAEPWVGTAEEITECWRQVAEDFAPFHINITTKLEVYLAAPEASRIRCIMTPTGNAAPGAGGVAFVGSFNSTGDIPCWTFNGGPVGSAMTASHEIGHTLGLGHDGTIPDGGYYGEHGSPFEVSWGPIMGAPFGANLSQWSKGEYLNADNTQDDLAIIVGNNNRMDYRADDYGGTLATATALNVSAAGAFSMPGVIERNTDFDSFVFSTSGGTLNVAAAIYSERPNIDILLELRNSSGGLVTSSNPDTQVTASINQALAAGTYELRVSGVGRGILLADGYSDYGCMGNYTLSGTVANAGYLMSVPRAAINGHVVGTLNRGAGGSYSITGGTDAAAFAVNNSTGVVSVANASLLGKYSYSFTASTPAGSATVTVNSVASDIVVDVWSGIGGNNVSDLTGSAAYSGPPTERRAVSELDLQGFSDNYGQRLRAYLVVPTTGSYNFWIASDDASQLRLSTSANPANAQLIAYENGVSTQYNWTQHASQASASKTLTAGQRYYLEVLHKEGGGGDYVAVAWEGPGISQAVIPASALIPFGNRPPLLLNLSASVQETATVGTLVATMTAEDPDAGDTWTFSIQSGNGAGLFQINPSSGNVTLAGALEESVTLTHVLGIRATDSAGNTADGTLAVHVVEPGARLEIYDGIGGNDVDNLLASPNYPNSPSRVEYLQTLEFQDRGDNYGSRMRAYLRVPETGDYMFWVAGDDDTELHLSTDSNPANAARIARTDTATNFREWTKFGIQQSSVRTLQAGVDYYIAVLHKEGVGGDHASAAIAGPGFERMVIPERFLSWELDNRAPTLADALWTAPKKAPAGTVIGTLEFDDPDSGTQPVYTILSGDPDDRFTVNPDGSVALAVDGYLLLGPTYNLIVEASDGSLTDTANVTVQVSDGGVKLERWKQIPGADITELKGPAKYPASPDVTEALTSLEFQNKGDDYGSVMTANVTVPTTGNYRFWLASDDQGELWISTDGNPANKQLFARTVDWNDFRDFDESTSQRSQLVNLQGGSSIYIEVLQKEASGGDHASVAWEGPGIGRTVISASATLKRYTGLEGDLVVDLTGELGRDPDEISYLPAFEFESLGLSYGSRASGYLTIPTTGNYTFWIASDDESELWISSDGDPSNKSKAAEVLTVTAFREYGANASQMSTNYALTAGDVIYLETLHVQGNGGDHLSVAWQGPGISRTPIPGSALSPVPNPITVPPILGSDDMDYPDGPIAGQTGGSGFNYDSFDGQVTASTSDWTNVSGAPVVASGKLQTNNNSVKREYNGPVEGIGTGANDGDDNHERSGARRATGRVFYRFQTTRSAGATWSGASSYDFGDERVFFGVPNVMNGGQRQFGLEFWDGTQTIRHFSGIPADTEPHLVIAVIDYDDDFVGIWVDPNASDFYNGGGTNSADAGGIYTPSFWSTAIRFGSEGLVTWDDLTIVTEWDDLMPIDPYDTDSDGMPDAWETANGLTVGIDDSGEDADEDGLTNLQEFEQGTDPQERDSDDDGVADGIELALGTNPKSAASTPGAGYADLRAWLPVEEGAGTTTADLSGYGNDGTLLNGPLWATGRVGDHAVTLDGINDHVALPPLGISTNTATLSGWAKLNGAQNNNTGLVFTRLNNTDTASGIWVTGTELGYQWNDQYWQLASGLNLPDGEWAFFALTVAPDRAILYLGLPDGTWSKFENIAPHAVDDFTAPTRIGSDNFGPDPDRYFRGDLDDIRIFDHALSEADVQTIFYEPFANESPVANNTSGGVAENSAPGTSVVTVSASDPNAGDVLAYSITAGDPGGLFAINSVGAVTTTAPLDYETTAQHVLTVTVTDDGVPMLQDTATVTISVLDVNEAPVVAITAPTDGTTHNEGDNIIFSGTSTDEENGNLTSGLTWSSDVSGALGTGGSVSTSSLAPGPHVITASSTDPGGQVGGMSIGITIEPGNTFANWLSDNGYTSGGFATDSDNNGLNDGAEYFFNQSPNDPGDMGNLPKVVRNGADLELRYTRLTDIDDVTATLQCSPTMGSWDPAQEDVDYEVISETPNGEETDVVLRLIGPKPFWRFAVTRN